jgi:hypothetical protein
MANLINDTDEQRFIDRIKCIAFREAKESGAEFITKKWIANKLKRSESWVKRNWNKSEDECYSDFKMCGRPLELSQESRNVIKASSNVQKESCAQDAQGSHTDY